LFGYQASHSINDMREAHQFNETPDIHPDAVTAQPSSYFCARPALSISPLFCEYLPRYMMGRAPLRTSKPHHATLEDHLDF
jgi:hypothetical protein